MMDSATALQIVLDLAAQNMIDDESEEEHNRQQEAIDIVTDLAVNHFGDN